MTAREVSLAPDPVATPRRGQCADLPARLPRRAGPAPAITKAAPADPNLDRPRLPATTCTWTITLRSEYGFSRTSPGSRSIRRSCFSVPKTSEPPRPSWVVSSSDTGSGGSGSGCSISRGDGCPQSVSWRSSAKTARHAIRWSPSLACGAASSKIGGSIESPASTPPIRTPVPTASAGGCGAGSALVAVEPAPRAHAPAQRFRPDASCSTPSASRASILASSSFSQRGLRIARRRRSSASAASRVCPSRW
jgi:hypothetical protein